MSVLSKSTFIRGCQCHKSLYLYKHAYQTRDPMSPLQAAIFRRGTNVGLLARELFPGGVDASPPSPFQYAKSVARTRELVASGAPVVYEAAFEHDGVLAAMDILVREDAKRAGGLPGYHAYEVKSSTSISDTYLLDVALQTWVMRGAGVPLRNVSIIHIDPDYVRGEELDIRKLFREVSVRAEIDRRPTDIGVKVQELKDVVAAKSTPDIEIGPQCFNPYPCDFLGTCWRHVPKYSVFDIARLSEQRKFELYHAGVVRVADIPDDFELSDRQRLQIQADRTGEPTVDRAALAAFLDTVRPPVWFLDFEAFQPAVPLFPRTRPYQQIPFQFSLHRLEAGAAETGSAAARDGHHGALSHTGFIAHAGGDPRLPFLEALTASIGDRGSVVVYNRSFECGIMEGLAELYPEYRARVDAIVDRVVDLMIPFRDLSLYLPEMHGSHSIKAVLPALVPSLSYRSLAIHDGAEASAAYGSLTPETDKRTVSRIRRRLSEYCKLDTLAMVRIYEVLGRWAQP